MTRDDLIDAAAKAIIDEFGVDPAEAIDEAEAALNAVLPLIDGVS